MGVGLYNLSQAEITKLAMESKSKLSGTKQQSSDPRLTMNGSIFASAKTTDAQKTSTTTKSPSDFPTGLKNDKSGDEHSPKTKGQGEGGTPSADEGKAMASDMKSQSKELKSRTQSVEKDGTAAKKASSEAKATTKSTVKNQKNLEKTLKATTAEFTNNQEEINKTSEAMKATLLSVQADKAELESLTAGGDTSVFSLSLAGDEKSGGVQGNPDQKRINEIAARLNQKISIIDTQGKQITTLQKASTKSLNRMNKLNTQYTKTIKNSQKAVKNEQAQNSKVIQVADKVSQISSAVTTGGQTLEIVGQGMIAAGSAMSWAAGAGAALIAAGEVMMQVGTVAQTVGNYGTMASELTKGIAFAAEGNLAGAMASITTAAASGQSAVKSTKAMGKTMGDIKNTAMEAKQNLAAGAEARDAVKNMSADQLNGMSKKEVRKSVQANILNDNDLGTGKFKDIRAGITSDQVNSAKDKTITTIENAQTNAQNNLAKNGITDISKGKGKRQLKRMTKGGLQKTTGETMQNVVKNKQTFLAANAGKDKFKQIAGSAQTLASLFGNNGTQNTGYTTTPKKARTVDPQVMARLREIQNNRFTHGRHIA